MISRDRVLANLGKYSKKQIKIGVLASHSALDVCDGAVDEGFRTVAVCQEGRDRTYAHYFKAHRDPDGKVIRGMVDEVIMVKKFKEATSTEVQRKLIERNVLFVPNRSFTSYCGMDAVENDFDVPLVGCQEPAAERGPGGTTGLLLDAGAGRASLPEEGQEARRTSTGSPSSSCITRSRSWRGASSPPPPSRSMRRSRRS